MNHFYRSLKIMMHTYILYLRHHRKGYTRMCDQLNNTIEHRKSISRCAETKK